MRVLGIVLGLCLITSFAFAEIKEQYKGLKELPNQRSYNQKVYDNSKKGGDGSKRYCIHTSHIHYKNGQGKFEDVDTALTFDDTKKTYRHSKASYHCEIPEYADGWFEFHNVYEGVNHTIKARPIANHVKGILGTQDENDGLGHDWVVYKDAFGQNIDLKVTAYWAGLRKTIRINEKPANLEDLHFDFELDLSSQAKILKQNNKEWVIGPQALDFKGKQLRIGKDDKFSYFRDAKLWDSGGLREKIDIQLYFEGGKLYLRKTIKAEVLQKAIYPLYTDHPTSYYAGAGDGIVCGYYDVSSCPAATQEEWNTIHDYDGSTGAASYYNHITDKNGPQYTAGYLYLYRNFFPIDTSGIDDGATITAATFKVVGISKENYDNDGDDWIGLVQTSQASTASLVNADYDNCGAVDDPTEGSDTRIDLGNIVVDSSTYNDWPLNATGLGWIDKGGYTKLGLREGHDCLDEIPADDNYWVLINSEAADTGVDPYLDVTTTLGGPPDTVLRNSVLKNAVLKGTTE